MVAQKSIIEPDPEAGMPHSVSPEWIGTSAKNAIPCQDCNVKAGELCVSKDTKIALFESHPARIMAYVTNKPEHRPTLIGQQKAID